MTAPVPRLSNRAAIVTGAAGGIGSAVALSLAREGADVCLADTASTSELARAVSALGRKAVEVRLDVTRKPDVQAMVERALAAFGRLDILVTVAGTTSFGSAAALDEAEWDRVVAINLKGVFLSCQAAIAPMRAAGYGRIINIGSVLAKNGGNPRPWLAPEEQERAANVAYGASKAGVHAMTLFLAKELAAHGITVNCVAPGPIASAMTGNLPEQLKAMVPVGRMGTAEDVASAVSFLAGESASFITGEVFDVNGGLWPD